MTESAPIVSRTLTSLEAEYLDYPFNLADGHAHLRVRPGLFDQDNLVQASTAPLAELEQQFLTQWAKSIGGRSAAAGTTLLPSASLAVDSVAKHLARSGVLEVGLIHPTFDNLHRILIAGGLRVSPFEESDAALIDAASRYPAVFLVLPNNPTGWVPGAPALEKFFRIAETRRVIVVIDRSFRFFLDEDPIIELLTKYDVEWVTVDDTGKTWSTLECKISLLEASSHSRHQELRDVSQEITLQPSPLSLSLLTRAIAMDEGASRIRATVDENRLFLTCILEASPLTPVTLTKMSVEWLAIRPSTEWDAPALTSLLARGGVGVLPGRQFHWADRAGGDLRLRVALARETTEFAAGAKAMAHTLETIRREGTRDA